MSGSPGRRRGLVIWVLAGLALAAVALVAGAPDSGSNLDPRSTGERGAAGLVRLLDRLGGDVRVSEGLPVAGDDYALLLRDRLNEAQRRTVLGWVRAGGDLVVATDVPSDLAIWGGRVGGGGLVGRNQCTIPALLDIETLDPGPHRVFLPGLDASCFGDDRGAFLVRARVGAGSVTAIGAGSVWDNTRLDQLDNAGLAARLMRPEAGSQIVVVEASGPPGTGDESLADLVPDRVVQALAQLAVAFGVFALARARRFGAPVVERDEVQIAGSELVNAVGRMIDKTGDPERVAEVIRRDARTSLGELLGLGPGASVDSIARAAAARSERTEPEVAAALSTQPVSDERDVLRIAHLLESIRQEVTP